MKMKSLKFIVRLSLFVLVLFAVAASTHAQQCPGYNPTMSQGAPGSASGILPPSPCAGKSLFSTASFYETNSTTDYCGSLDTGGYLSHTATVTGNGVASCTPVVVYCEPFFEAQVTVATNQQDYNRFYYRAYDYTYTSSGCVRTPFTRQDFWQCPWYSCPPPPGGGGGGGGGGPRYCNPCDGSNDSTCCSPILIDTTGHGYFLTDATNGVLFDITADGTPIQMAWTAAGSGDAFLVLPEADGLVHSGRDLFGSGSPQPPSAHPNGFAALAVYDLPANGGNGDGIIDSRDAIFSSLRLWIDANHDGISQPEELHTLASLGVNSISLNYTMSQRTDQYGNIFRYRALVNPERS
jgi:hypothetical protein